MKEFVVKEDQAFRLRVKSWKCLVPDTLNAVEFIQEQLRDGEVIDISTYQFFMSDKELTTLSIGLVTA
jgi:hypothetical protein